jgi:transcriptional regulator GlxA family with amidase domain
MLFIENLAQAQAQSASELISSKSLSDLETYLIKNVGEDLSLDDLALSLGISKFALTRLFHKRYGIAPMRWLWSFRAHLAKDVISMQLGLPLMDVLTLCGFNSPQHFSRFFRKTFRQAPSKLMKELGGQGLAKDLAKARQDLYERFDGIVSHSLRTYIDAYRLPTPARAEVTAPSTFHVSEI